MLGCGPCGVWRWWRWEEEGLCRVLGGFGMAFVFFGFWFRFLEVVFWLCCWKLWGDIGMVVYD